MRFAVPALSALLALCAVLTGCGGSSGGAVPIAGPATASPTPSGGSPTATPTAKASASPTATPQVSPTPARTATPSPSPSSSAAFTATQVIAALDSVQTHWNTETLGSGPEAAIASLVSWIKTQRAFKDAGADQGTVWATLSDGTPAVFFVDHLQDSSRKAAAGRRNSSGMRRPPAGRRALRSHEGEDPGQVVFLVNTLDDSGAFTPSRQADYAAAFMNVGYPQALSYGSISLENIASVGRTPSEFVDFATHGGNAFNPRVQKEQYLMDSTTVITTGNYPSYYTQINAGNLVPALELIDPVTAGSLGVDGLHVPVYSFTSTWLTNHMKFTPGAVVDNQSCFGANVYAAGQSFVSALEAAGVGLYMGWTKSVDGLDADETDAYLIDRLIGEQSPSLSDLPEYVDQDTPPERPFQLTDILIALPSKPRTNPIREGATAKYALNLSTQPKAFDTNSESQPSADGPTAKFTYTGYGTAQVPAYVPPGITSAVVNEGASPEPTLTISGEFSQTPGQAYITTGGLPDAIALPVLSWSTQVVVAELPPSAPSSGNVIVGEMGVPSNPVPLTKWSGTYNLGRSYAFTGDGTGSFSYSSTLNIDLRADVHRWRGTVDGPLNVDDFVASPMRSSTGTITAKAGSYTANAQPGDSAPPLMLTFTPKGPVTLTPFATITATGQTTLDNYINIQPSAMEMPATSQGCSRGSASDYGDANFRIYCTTIQAASSDIATCSDNQNNTVCGGPDAPPIYGTFDTTQMYGSDAIAAFQLDLTPAYGITVNFHPPADPNANSSFEGQMTTSTTTWKASFQGPSFAPTAQTPG